MTVKQIIKESMDRNPMNMKEALQEELKSRVAEAVEKRINEASKDLKKGDYVSHVDDEKVGKVTGVSGDKESVDVKWNDGETGSYDAEDLKVVKEDLDSELEESYVVKYAKRKGGKISVAKHDSKEDAEKFLSDLKADGYNGIVVKEDLDAELNEETKSIDDFMKLFKLKDEPEEGKRMNLGGYPFDYDEFDTDEVFLTAVDVDAAKGLVKEFKKRGFDASSSGQTVSISFE